MRAAVIGSGAWGTALAVCLYQNGHDVVLWSYAKSRAEQLERTGGNPRLPGVALPSAITHSSDYGCVTGCRMVVIACPSFSIRDICRGIAPYLEKDAVLVSVTKGIERETHLRMSQVVQQETGKPVVVLTGPSHAEEVSGNLPTGCLAASEDRMLAEFVQDAFMSDTFRIYTSPDPVGAELGGALKNVIALCAGVTDGLGYGDNTKAALMTRGIAEVARLGSAMGCNPQTFLGLAGIGDLIVTATSVHSRNNRCGLLLGQGVEPKEAIRQVGMVVEGVNALPAAMKLAKEYQVEMPLAAAVNAVVNEGADPQAAVAKLMARDQTTEIIH